MGLEGMSENVRSRCGLTYEPVSLSAFVLQVIGKNFLYERVLDLEIFGQPPVKNTTWYGQHLPLCGRVKRAAEIGSEYAVMANMSPAVSVIHTLSWGHAAI